MNLYERCPLVFEVLSTKALAESLVTRICSEYRDSSSTDRLGAVCDGYYIPRRLLRKFCNLSECHISRTLGRLQNIGLIKYELRRGSGIRIFVLNYPIDPSVATQDLPVWNGLGKNLTWGRTYKDRSRSFDIKLKEHIELKAGFGK